jgi:hypothetical protein
MTFACGVSSETLGRAVTHTAEYAVKSALGANPSGRCRYNGRCKRDSMSWHLIECGVF